MAEAMWTIKGREFAQCGMDCMQHSNDNELRELLEMFVPHRALPQYS